MVDLQRSKKLGSLLLEAGLITQAQLDQALKKQKWTKKKFGEIIVELGFVSEIDIAKTFSRQLGIEFIDFSTTVVEPEAIQMISEKICLKHMVMPISVDKHTLKAAFADPLDLAAIDDLSFASGRTVKPLLSTARQIKEAISQYYHLSTPVEELVKGMDVPGVVEIVFSSEDEIEVSELIRKSEDPPIVKMVNGILASAVEHNASDIHIEPHQKKFVMRERIDGILRDVMVFPKWTQGFVTSRIKIMAGLDITEKRIPQDGRIKIRIQGREMDLRVSTLPTIYGEKIVIRLLNARPDIFSLDEIGFSREDLKKIKAMLRKNQGIVLVAGPTGSGKTSTLYAMLNYVVSPDINVVTIEDPVEYEISSANQVAVNEKIGLTFPFVLRSILRQDPDIIMLGEIRDSETALISFQSAMTGHSVFSSIHTNSAAGTITRLKNIGVMPYLISSSLNGVVSQRLVRLLCPACKEEYNPEPEEFINLGVCRKDLKDVKFYRAKGCHKCNYLGYKGRIGLFEVLVVNKQIKKMILEEASEDDIEETAVSFGMKKIMVDGIEKVAEGLTSLSELNRIFAFEEETMNFCPKCHGYLKSNFVACPFCCHSISTKCYACGKHVHADWKYCPFCMAELNLMQYSSTH
ncbi:MAG: type II secretion system protein GspE [Candidatus Schekmanbacteria bacterium]|nr:MAG: type II secretion system protein GspE [Candidatus Schekmanbacteria bacterium]